MGTIEALELFGQDTDGYYAELWRLSGAKGIFWDPQVDAWVVTSYRECRALLVNSALSKARLRLSDLGLPPSMDGFVNRAQVIADRQMIFDESTAAHRARRAWANALRPSEGPGQAGLTSCADDMLARLPYDTDVDWYTTVLRPYVSHTIGTQLRLAEEERQKLYPLIYRYADFLDGKTLGLRGIGEAVISILLLSEFVSSRFERLRHIAPQAADDKARWCADYLLTLVAGHESTAYMLGTALLHASANPRLLADDNRIRATIKEALRFDSPIQMVGRVARDPIDIGGCKILPGDRVLLHIGAANRDPTQFKDANVFVSGRRHDDMLAFGLGPSRCIGMSLALAQARAFLGAFRRMAGGTDMHLGRQTWAHGLAGRSFHALPIQLHQQ